MVQINDVFTKIDMGNLIVVMPRYERKNIDLSDFLPG